MKIDFYSQPMARDGSSIAQFASQAIKDSNLIPRHVMLREALQNSCDQRISKTETIDFSVSAFTMTGRKLGFLKELLDAGRANGDPLRITRLLSRDKIEILAFADRGTKGLGGEPDASKPNAGNFAKYFYIFGRLEDGNSTDGGAFGAGRTTLNNASQISTVLIFSQYRDELGKINSRFMGLANAHSFEHKEKMYTGRHWWCDYRDEHAYPFEGKEASEIAAKLGMDSYLDSETGFVAYVISPVYVNSENEEIAQVERRELVEDLRDAAYLYGWPHMIKVNNFISVNFRFILDGQEIQQQDPKTLGHLVNFIESYEKVLNGFATKTHSQDERLVELYFNDVSKQSRLGILSWKYSPEKLIDAKYADEDLIPKHSVALIRNAGFVVRYEPVNPYADGIVTRGVFLVDPSFEPVFRESEPIAHDTWIPSRLRLQKGDRNPVKQCLDQIRSSFKSINDGLSTVTSGEPMVFAANVLGSVIGGAAITGNALPKTSKSSGTNRKRLPLSFSLQGEPYLISSNANSYRASFAYSANRDSIPYSRVKIEFDAKIMLDGGVLESEPPIGAYRPRIVKIVIDGVDVYSPNDKDAVFSKSIEFDGSIEIQDIEVIVECLHGLAVTCKLGLETEK